MKIIAKTHFTATEKRAIKDIIAKGWLAGHTKRKSYFLTKTEEGYDVHIQTPETNDWGKRIVRNGYGKVVL